MLTRVERRFGGRYGRVRTVLLLLAIILAISVTLVAPSWARKRGRPMPFEEVATTWVGLSSDEQYLVRLVLQDDHTGAGGYTFLDEEPRTFHIVSWSYDAGQIEIEPVPPAGPPSWVSPMQGSVLGVTMHLEASGNDWRVEITLRRESELVGRWELLKREMMSRKGRGCDRQTGRGADL